MKELEFDIITLLGVPIHLIGLDDLLKIIRFAIQKRKQYLIPNYNLNAIRLIHKDREMREFYKAAHFRHIDGMALVFLGKFLGLPIRKKQRVTYIDFAPHIFKEASENNYKVYFLGSKPGIFEKAKEKILKEYPTLMIEGHHGYFDESKNSLENRNVVNSIKEYDPDILIVGMGMPRQEKWILSNRKDLSARVILTGGAVMDYLTGEVPTPPRVMGALGFEWLFRLLGEPKRLWRRYLLEPWSLAPIFLNDLYRRLLGYEQTNVLNE